jgi:mannose-6-phosphate isomerase
MSAVRLAPNLVDHFYVGGPKIAALRGIETTSPRQPEEWLAATVTRAGDVETGLARTTDGDLLRDRVAADPAGWLGDGRHAAARSGPADTGLLVKLLDAGQRLPVHVHPDRDFAARHLDCPYGKTEAWYVLHSDGDGAVYLGWREDVDPRQLEQARDAQDSEWMLSRLNRVEVRPGDGILVPARTAHAIGEGVFLTEVQEPTDFSILLEWSITTSTRDESHLGVGFDVAMRAVSCDGLGGDDLARLVRHVEPGSRASRPQPCLPQEADPYFRLDLVAPADAPCPVAAGFAAVLVLHGSGELAATADRTPLRRGDVLAVPASAGDWHVHGDVAALVARPGAGWPASLAGEGR